MVDISDEELIKWGNEKYPELAGNIKLLRVLWSKLYRTERGESAKFSFNKKIVEVNEGDRARLNVVVIDVKRAGKYVGCVKCRRKQCNCGVEKKVMFIRDYLCADDTGELVIGFVFENEDAIKIGDVVEVEGRMYKKKFFVNRFEVKRRVSDNVDIERKEKAKQLLKAMEGVGLTEVSELEKWLRRKGFELKDVIDDLKIVKVNNKDMVML